MRIIHLSDLHFGERYKEKIKRMLPSYIKTINKINTDKKIDLIVFTGDIVWSGVSMDVFSEVDSNFVKPTIDSISLEKDKFILCPGNHDMSNVNELPAITDYIDKLQDNDELNSFVTNKDQQFDLSYDKSNNYLTFAKKKYTEDSISQLFHSFERVIRGHKIGIVSLHTPWRSFIGNHSGHLLIPTQTIYDAYNTLPQCDLYISLMHHPLNDLQPYNKDQVEDILFEKFHINFSGHYHKKRQGVIFTYDIGMLSISAMASMSGNDGSMIGFSVVDIDVDTFEIDISNYTYVQHDNAFLESSSVSHKLPMNEEKSSQVNILKRLKELHEDVTEEANSLLINYDDTEDRTFIEQFNNPILKEKSHFESIEDQNKLKNFKTEQLFKENYIIFSKDKYGKTSLLRKLQLDLIEGFKKIKTIPIYMDFKNIDRLESISLLSEIRKIFPLPKAKAKLLISKSKFHFLIDKVDKKWYIDVNKFLKERNYV